MRRIWCGFSAAAIVVFSVTASAETSKSTNSRIAIFESQARLLDGRLSQQYSSSVRLRPDADRIEISPDYRGSYQGEYLVKARSAARKHRIPEDLFLRLVQQESGFDPTAVSHKGAIGLAQLMPGTAEKLGVDPMDPTQNLEGGARYLRMQYERFRSWRLALAAYNAGPGAVERHGGVPPYRETQNYVRVILGP